MEYYCKTNFWLVPFLIHCEFLREPVGSGSQNDTADIHIGSRKSLFTKISVTFAEHNEQR